MDKKAREAAVRLTQLNNGVYNESYSQADAVLVARAYLAAHPADDAEPVTRDWLLHVGFLPDGDTEPGTQELSRKIWSQGEHTDYGEHPAMHFTVAMADLSAWLEAYDQGGKSLALIELPPKRTRGEVRRLCAALGIQLQSGEPAKT